MCAVASELNQKFRQIFELEQRSLIQAKPNNLTMNFKLNDVYVLPECMPFTFSNRLAIEFVYDLVLASTQIDINYSGSIGGRGSTLSNTRSHEEIDDVSIFHTRMITSTH